MHTKHLKQSLVHVSTHTLTKTAIIQKNVFSKWVIDLKIKCQTIKLLGEKKGENLRT